jgi:hypothetical protein
MRMLSNSGTSRGLTAKRSNRLIIAGLTAIAVLALCATSCNVTRVVTNESKYTTRGDTAVVITTKTVETYDASKKL